MGRGSLLWLIAVVTAGLAAWAGPRAAHALETDQFTAPAAPLADIGPELAAEAMRRIDAAVARVNDRAADHARRAEASDGFWRRQHLRARERQLSERALAVEVYRALAGPGLPECHMERWVRKHRFAHGPARYEMSSGASVYGPAWGLARSPFIFSLSPTVNAFGVHFGADKIGHLFQQGFQYFDTFARAAPPAGDGAAEAAEAPGASAEAGAVGAAVRRGVDQERGLYGLALVGVYSNADLAANYAGLKLYLNLTRPVCVGDAVRPPLFVLRDGQWRANAEAGGGVGGGSGVPRADAFLRPFVSHHLNEALNPPLFAQPTRDTVRARWRRRAAAWVAFYGSTREGEARRVRALATWHGEPYGHSGFAALVTASDTCFAAPDPSAVHVVQVPLWHDHHPAEAAAAAAR